MHQSFKLWIAEADQHLPAILYHVTTAGGEIDREGFRTALQHQKGTTLGGGFPEAVSFTDDLGWARSYQRALEVVQELFYEGLMKNRSRLWMRLRDFGPDYNKLQQIEQMLTKEPTDEAKIETLLFWLPSATQGRFPAIFGAGLRKRLTANSTVSLLKISTLAGNGRPGPQKWTTNPRERECRIYDPENFDMTTLDFI